VATVPCWRPMMIGLAARAADAEISGSSSGFRVLDRHSRDADPDGADALSVWVANGDGVLVLGTNGVFA